MMRTIASLIAATALAWPAVADELSGPAPDFTLQARSGETVSLSDLQGDVVMVNFWATWCAPCRQEMPHLEALYQRYKNLGFTLLAVNVEDNRAGADKWLAERPVSFPVLFDPKNEVSKLYDVVAMPSTVMVGRDGTMRYIHHGYQPGYENEYQSQIRALLRE